MPRRDTWPDKCPFGGPRKTWLAVFCTLPDRRMPYWKSNRGRHWAALAWHPAVGQSRRGRKTPDARGKSIFPHSFGYCKLQLHHAAPRRVRVFAQEKLRPPRRGLHSFDPLLKTTSRQSQSVDRAALFFVALFTHLAMFPVFVAHSCFSPLPSRPSRRRPLRPPLRISLRSRGRSRRRRRRRRSSSTLADVPAA